MFISEYFIFDGIRSSDFGIYNVRVNSGMLEAPFGIGRSITEEKVNGGERVYFYGTEKEPLVFDLTFSLLDERLTMEKRMALVKWLFQEEYKPFISADHPEVIHYVMAVGDGRRFDNGSGQGYFRMQFRCSAPHGFSPISIQDFDLSGNTAEQLITMENRSNIASWYYPEITIEMKGDTGVTLKNLNDGGKEFRFTGLQSSETIYVNNGRKQIISSLDGVYRYDNFNKNWLRLPYGVSRISVVGRCRIQARSQFPIAL